MIDDNSLCTNTNIHAGLINCVQRGVAKQTVSSVNKTSQVFLSQVSGSKHGWISLRRMSENLKQFC